MRTYWQASAVLIGFSAFAAQGQAIELPLDADNCAIHRALKGENHSNCSEVSTLGPDRGIVLRLQPTGTIPTAVQLTPNIPPQPVVRISTKPKPKPKKSRFSRAAAPSEDGYFIQFAFDSTHLEPQFTAHLDRLAQVLQSPDMSGSCLKVIGHTDTIGKDTHNKELSQKRAIVVATYLSQNKGVAATRIAMEARGETKPLPDIAGGDPRNRRVEFATKASENGC
jgi:outer membrane protein OmpA-like peptidoglycan-associated protein